MSIYSLLARRSLLGAFALTALATAYSADTEWVAEDHFSYEWMAPANWNNGVPNNGGTTYNAIIGQSKVVLINNDSITIDNLSIGRDSNLSVLNGNLTVVGTSDFGNGPGFAYLAIESYLSPATIDLGSLNSGAFSGNTLDNIGLDVSGDATLQWRGADIHTIGSNADLTVRGSASVRNSLDDSDALANLATNNGWFRVESRSFTTQGSFSNTGLLGATAGTITINGTLAQNSGNALTAGTLRLGFSSFPAPPEEPSIIKWEGARIDTIGSEASIYLYGPDTSIRNSLDDSDALAGLAQNDGTLFIKGRTLEVNGDFSNNGILAVESGILSLTGGGGLVLGDDSELQILFSLNDMEVWEPGQISADGAISLDGILYVNLEGGMFTNPDPLGTFEILHGQSIVGTFDNVADGERLYIEGGIFDGGSFLFDIDGDRVLLSDFQTIPEPSTCLLVAIGIGGIALARRKRKKAAAQASAI